MASPNVAHPEIGDSKHFVKLINQPSFGESTKILLQVTSSFNNKNTESPSLQVTNKLSDPPENLDLTNHFVDQNIQVIKAKRSKSKNKKGVTNDVQVKKKKSAKKILENSATADNQGKNLKSERKRSYKKRKNDSDISAKRSKSEKKSKKREKGMNMKRYLDFNGVEDVVRKKVHNENANAHILEAELEPFHFIKVLESENNHPQELDSKSTSPTCTDNKLEMGDHKNDNLHSIVHHKTDSISGVKFGVPQDKKSSDVAKDRNTEKMQEENRLVEEDFEFGCIKIHEFVENDASNSHQLIQKEHTVMTSVDETNKDTDFLGLDCFEIKILGEVFLCHKCQSEISSDDSRRGFKDICSSCHKKELQSFKNFEPPHSYISDSQVKSKIFSNQPMVDSESDFYSNSQTLPIQTLMGKKFTQDEETKLYFGKELQFEHDISHPLEQDDSWSDIDILDPKYRKEKLLCIGPNYQAEITPLNLYAKRKKREIKRLWNPKRIKSSLFETLSNEINTRNAVSLLQEEIAEILVRNNCEYEKASQWSLKSNPDFLFYVKRKPNPLFQELYEIGSSNRRRSIAKLTQNSKQ